MTKHFFSWPTSQTIAQLEADGFRGRCVQIYAEVELELSKTLIALMKRYPQISMSPIEQFKGKLDTLNKAVALNGPCAAQGQDLGEEIAIFQDFYKQRAALVHANARTTLAKGQSWRLSGGFIPIGAAEESPVEFTREEAAEFEKDLRATAERLCRHMSALKESASQALETRSFSAATR